MKNTTKHMKTLLDWTGEEVLELIDFAYNQKQDFLKNGASSELKGKTLALFFEKPSLRTITTFQVGMHQLGGNAVLLDPNSIGLGKREAVSDVAMCLGRWVDALAVRCFEQKLVDELAKYSSMPVINALTDSYHPCQALAFGLTVKEHFGELRGKHVVFIGDGNNVANSLFILAAKTGMHFTLACPKGFEQPQKLIESLQDEMTKTGASYSMTHDPKEAVQNADILYSDVWVSMGEEKQKAEKQSHFIPYQINKELMELAPGSCKVTHCLPAHRGEEITAEIMDSPLNLCFDEAENRLHAQKALLCKLILP